VITLLRFRRIEHALRLAGYGETIDWSERIQSPETADEFAANAIYVICNSGMRVTVATPIFVRCMESLSAGQSATLVFGHPGKAPAIDALWRQRHELFEGYCRADAKIEFLGAIPWIGPVTKYHLAKNLGADTAKPDLHLERLARRDRTTTERLCRRLAKLTGYRVATIDTVLWRACADGILSSRRYELEGWKSAFRGKPTLADEIEHFK
jgi:hypothetical protein